ncbi:MAG: helix-turn-helix domain-containing protein [Treponema sp.]|nr:helix-turn-helix domain-containing protein [Treponema sp.]
MGFKDNLKTELDYSGMLIKELAVRSGVNRRTIDNYLSTHNCLPSAEAAVKIAQVLGVSVEYLITGQESAGGKVDSLFVPELRPLLQTIAQLNEEHRAVIDTIARALKETEKQGCKTTRLPGRTAGPNEYQEAGLR